MTTTESLYERIRAGVSGPSETAGIRVTANYAPAGGPGTKIYPPTFPVTPTNEWKRYLVERRFRGRPDAPSMGNEPIETVLTDSIQSQANRVEEALQDALDAGEISIPVLDLVLDLLDQPMHITNLVAPHRGVDAYFRDAQLDGVDWEKTPGGRAIVTATPRTARALYEQVPSDLIFGHWDSQRGSQRARKVARCYSSENDRLEPPVGPQRCSTGRSGFDPKLDQCQSAEGSCASGTGVG